MSTDTKTVLITGASTGIGRAAVDVFAARGWNVAATMRTPDAASTMIRDGGPAANGGTHGAVRIFRLDVTDGASIEKATEDVLRTFGRIDVLVNNAGYGLVGPFEAMEEAQIRRQFETNVFGLMATTRAVLPHMRERKSGVIVNVSSVGGRLTFPLYSVYHATKWAVNGFSESLTFELKEHGIRVKIIEPGPIKTDLYTRSQDRASKPGLTAYDRFVASVYPLLQSYGVSAPGPEGAAEAIWKAATDGSNKLRYKPNGVALMAMRRLLPDRAYREAIAWQLGAD
jgi:NAD(P)-dependent dehydrogenase (short-subunit alcohol dehydrogenase family)